jgi:hypothetical protein
MADNISPALSAGLGAIGTILAMAVAFGIFKLSSPLYDYSKSYIFDGLPGLLARVLINSIPISLFTFGIIADIIKQEFRASIPSITALLLLIVLRVFSSSQNFPLFADQGEANNSVFWCALPGFEFLENPWLPGSALATTIIIFYYLWWAIGTPYLPFVGAGVGIAFAAVCMQFIFGNCESYYIGFESWFGSLFSKGKGALLGASVIGILVSGLLWTIVHFAAPYKNPLQELYAFGNSNLSGGTKPIPNLPGVSCPDGQTYSTGDLSGSAGCRCNNSKLPPINGRCYSAENPNQSQSGVVQEGEQTFVAELYKNGKLVTDSLSK